MPELQLSSLHCRRQSTQSPMHSTKSSYDIMCACTSIGEMTENFSRGKCSTSEGEVEGRNEFVLSHLYLLCLLKTQGIGGCVQGLAHLSRLSWVPPNSLSPCSSPPFPGITIVKSAQVAKCEMTQLQSPPLYFSIFLPSSHTLPDTV